jgi:hypothetical protein
MTGCNVAPQCSRACRNLVGSIKVERDSDT